MNCKPGDLAWIVGLHPSLGEAEGRIVQLVDAPPVVYEGEPSWQLTKRVDITLVGNGRLGDQRFYLGESVWFDQLQDKYLRPIRDPGDDASDETLEWLPVPSRDEVTA